MKKMLKTIGIILGILILVLGIGMSFVLYEFNYKKTEILKESEGSYTLTMYQVGVPGWPFGPVNGEFILDKDGKKINTCSFSVRNDGGGLSSGNAVMKWTENCVKIRVSGEEQEDMLYTLGFEGTSHSEKAGPWFTEEEVIAMIKETYGAETTFLKKEGSAYLFRAQVSQSEDGDFDFIVEQNKATLVDNYRNTYFKHVSDIYFKKYYLQVEWRESGMGAWRQYIPAFSLPSSNDREIMSFCELFCDYVEYCIGMDPLGEELQYFQAFPMAVAKIQFTFQPTVSIEAYDRTKMYNELYSRIDEVLHIPEKDLAGSKPIDTKKNQKEISQEMLDYYMTIEPSCSYQTDHMEYRMVAVDRALGSSFYVLLGVEEQGKICTFVNPDPYNGSGGDSRWITFLDENIGFSCLSYAAGSYGSLYRTDDGGSSWEVVKYPSAKAKLPYGTYYNPFVMPEKVYEEDGVLFMEAGQGADGDYYDELGFCHGLYQSFDEGINWEFVKNITKER